ncbi:MAG: FAS1-like dehydratase domain-containing protein [Egibacteraceae bacterium]
MRGEGVIGLNRDRIGHRYPTYRYEVSAEKIREYADATGAGDDDGQRREGDPAPPTFAACFTVLRGAAQLFSDEGLGAHGGLLHGSQEYEFHRPVCSGDTLECTPAITGIATRRGNDFLTLQIDCLDAATGEPVVTSRATLVFLGSGDQ